MVLLRRLRIILIMIVLPWSLWGSTPNTNATHADRSLFYFVAVIAAVAITYAFFAVRKALKNPNLWGASGPQDDGSKLTPGEERHNRETPERLYPKPEEPPVEGKPDTYKKYCQDNADWEPTVGTRQYYGQ